MRQVLQHLRTGKMEVAELPDPMPAPGKVLVRTRTSLISPGTEKMLVEFSKAGLLAKARQQPEKVQQVLEKMRTDGLLPTLEAVFRKLDEPMPLGYSSAGVVVETGAGVLDLHPGDRVAGNGPHAELVCVPRLLCTRLPEGVGFEEGAFTVMGSIALQAVRLTAPTLGEKFVVIGMGMLGLLAVQLLRANGCDVMAVDINPERLAVADAFGARTLDAGKGGDVIAAANAWTAGRGADGVIIAASSRSDEIIHQAAQACRKRGRVVLLGVVGLNLKRNDFYEKEITFQVSCSYGPGRYDEAYEQEGKDYPIGFVRWTEQRNFDAVLELIAAGRLDVKPLITGRFPIADALGAYEEIRRNPGALGVLLQYPDAAPAAPVVRTSPERTAGPDEAAVGVIGAGNFARGILLPALAGTPARLIRVADIDPAAARHAADKFGAGEAVADYRRILDDPAVRAVFIVVGHHLHARFVCEALEAGKHVFVEKPLAISGEELDRVAETARRHPELQLLVGFNRRFSPHGAKAGELLRGRAEPLSMSVTVNAGFIPADHWTQDPDRGGGRIIGEGCHFIDLLVFLSGSRVATVSAVMAGPGAPVREDRMAILLGFEDGSIGTVNYFANGSRTYPKEMLEVFSDGRVLRLENFRVTRGYGFRGFKQLKTIRQDKGHGAELAEFVERIAAGGPPVIPFDVLENVTRASLLAVESARSGRTLHLSGGEAVNP